MGLGFTWSVQRNQTKLLPPWCTDCSQEPFSSFDSSETNFEKAWGFSLVAYLLSDCFCGMSFVLSSAGPATALCGYVVMGLGLAPVVPTIFSLAGKCKGITASEASSFIAIVAYGGLLVVPPTLGWIASHSSLGTALCLVLVFCALAFVISLILPRLKDQLNLSGSLEP